MKYKPRNIETIDDGNGNKYSKHFYKIAPNKFKIITVISRSIIPNVRRGLLKKRNYCF